MSVFPKSITPALSVETMYIQFKYQMDRKRNIDPQKVYFRKQVFQNRVQQVLFKAKYKFKKVGVKEVWHHQLSIFEAHCGGLENLASPTMGS